MRRKIFSLTLVVISGLVIFGLSQPLTPSALQALEEYKVADDYYQQATALNSSPDYTEEKEKALNGQALTGFHRVHGSLKGYDSLKFFTAFKIGELEHYFENHAKALQYYGESIALQRRAHLPDSLLFKPLLYSGLIYYNQSQFDTAIHYFQRAEQVQVKYGNKLQERERLYNVFGVLYYETGNYIQAKNYIEKALEVLPKDHPYYKDLYINYQINLGQINLKLENYDEANRIYQEILPLNINKAEILHNIGLINLYLGSARKAVEYFQKVRFNNQKDIRLFTNIGTAYLNLEEKDSAFKYFQQALAVKVPVDNTTFISLGGTYKGLADLLVANGNLAAAVKEYQKAINHFYPAFTDTSITANPTRFSGTFSYINLFQAITAKATAFNLLYRSSGDVEWAKQELKAYQSAFELIDYVEKIYDSDEARLFINKIKYLVHNNPIETAYELFIKTKEKAYLESLYYFDQKNKASILSFNQQQNAANLGNQELRSLRREITRLSIKAANTNDSAALRELNANIRDKEIELSRVYERTGNKIEWNEKVPSIKELQKEMLDNETAILSYHLSDSLLYALVITNKDFKVERKRIPSTFSDDLEQLITSLHNGEGSFDSNWYDLLLPQVGSDVNKLVIIPDDELSYLPFESLQQEGKFLVTKYAIQYQYATTLLKKASLHYKDLPLSSFAPFSTFGNERFEQLRASEDEINGLPGKKYIGQSATKQTFLANVPHTGIFHLATHASAYDSIARSAFIAFYPNGKDNLLYANEIYGLSLAKTRLVILSACETGTGELEKGEGVMSLSRAFAYAGCPNVITSLWKADDVSTSYILKKLHSHLAEGSTINDALALAKKDYLSDPSINPRRKAPAFWAHLVFLGDYEPAHSTNYIPWMILTVFLIVLIGLLIKKPRKNGAVGGFQ